MNKSITISVGGIIAIAIAVFIGYLWGQSNVTIPEPRDKRSCEMGERAVCGS